MPTIFEKCADAIIEDLTDRKGLKHEWNNIDADIQAEIRAAWAAIIEDIFHKESAR
jgi:hypothetical protein